MPISQPGFDVDDGSWSSWHTSGYNLLGWMAYPSYDWYPDKLARIQITQLGLNSGTSFLFGGLYQLVDLTSVDLLTFNYRHIHVPGCSTVMKVAASISSSLSYNEVFSLEFSTDETTNQNGSIDVSSFTGNNYLSFGLRLDGNFDLNDYGGKYPIVYFDNIGEVIHRYVNAVTGSDSNPGTAALPWKTIDYAARNAPAGANVYITGDFYDEPTPNQIASVNNNVTWYPNGTCNIEIN